MTDHYEHIRKALEDLRERCAQEAVRITARRRVVASMISNHTVKPSEVAAAIRKIDVQQYYECAAREIEQLRAEVKQIAASEKVCRRIANEKTLEAMVLRQRLTAAKAEIETLREALKCADNELDWLDEDMDTCDHSVGVCTCDYWDMRRKMKAALAKENSND